MKQEKTSQIINKIKKEGIKPIPKWKANFSNYLYWIFLIILVLIGGFFASFLIMDYFNILPEIAREVNLRKFFFIAFITAPFLWIILLFLSLFFAFLSYRKTKRGYRHEITSIIIILVLIISFLAFIDHITNINSQAEKIFQKQEATRFNHFAPPREKRFLRPEEGILVGKIINIKKGEMEIKSLNQRWIVNFDEKTKIKGRGELKIGNLIFVFGKKINNQSFWANTIKIPPKEPLFFNKNHPPKKNAN